MDFGEKLEELNMTSDELTRFCKAMKDEKFCELLHEYAQEISNPKNKEKYEQEIRQLERERGMEVQFIHPSAHHVLKSIVDGKEKCFINICSNKLINKPTCEARRAENGQAGQYWSLPYSLTPGRPDKDSKGNKCMVYDVVFHPDTLDMADRNTRFMNLVNSTATEGVEDAFKVTLDKKKRLLKNLQYKGVPQAAVIRKPIPGQATKEESGPHDEAFPILYPDATPVKNPEPPSSSLAQNPSLPIQPHYTIKYRSLMDLQDYSFSRNPSLHQKEIVITIDLPLLTSAADVDVNVTDRKLALESQKPYYKLELQLSYPVDEDEVNAKFNKATKQLIITLPVQPAKTAAVVYTEGNQAESDDRDVMGSAGKADEAVDDAVDEAELVTEEHNEMNMSDASCEVQLQENRPVPEEDEEEDTKLHSAEENLLSATKSVQPSVIAPAVKLDTCTQFSLMAKIENGSQIEVPVVESKKKKAVSLIEELHDGPNVPTNPSNWVTGRSEVEQSLISDEPSQVNSPLGNNIIKSSCGPKETGALSANPESSTNFGSTLVSLNEQVDNADSSKQSQTGFSATAPAILREKNPEDGSEVIISEHTTTPALSFQNSLWFELD